MRRIALALAAAAALTVTTVPTAAAGPPPFPEVIDLPNGFQPEGIAVGRGTTFYVGSLAGGAVYRGDLRSGAGEIIVPPAAGRVAVGLEVDWRNRVWVAGGPTGTGSVYDGASGRLLLSCTFAAPGTAFVNDVVVTRDAAYFTDSNTPRLFVVPLGPGGQLPTTCSPQIQPVTVPNLAFPNLNGIETLPGDRALVVAHTQAASLYRVDPATGAATAIALDAPLPYVDGLVRRGTTLYAVQNFLNQISVVRLRADGRSGTVVRVLSDPDLDVPATAGLFGNALYAVNARFSTPPTPTTEYDVVRVSLR